MSRPVNLVFLSVLLWVMASASALAASQPPITGIIQGHEVCPQFIQFCGGKAWFAGKFIGQVGNVGHVTGSFLVGVSHDSLNTNATPTPTQITGGEWVIVIKQNTHEISGTVQPGGTLTYRAGSNAFDVALTLVLSPSDGSGTVTFQGMLDHNPFPPEIIGMLFQ
jgi:hypothetical protein